MQLLTIGEFARAAGLSAKALRLHDELGLLRPARVDEWTGYRYYSPGQLEQARLVAWLRRLGMPLAEIKDVGGLPPAEAPGAAAPGCGTGGAARFLLLFGDCVVRHYLRTASAPDCGPSGGRSRAIGGKRPRRARIAPVSSWFAIGVSLIADHKWQISTLLARNPE